MSERLESTQQNLAEIRRNNQILQDQISRLNNELANNEVQRAGLESQLRLSQWPPDSPTSPRDEELMRQLHTVQRERSELRGKVDNLTTKVTYQIQWVSNTLNCFCGHDLDPAVGSREQSPGAPGDENHVEHQKQVVRAAREVWEVRDGDGRAFGEGEPRASEQDS